MKSLIIASLIACSSFAQANEIIISKKVKDSLTDTINSDLSYLRTAKFSPNADKRTLDIMELSALNNKSANVWLTDRVNYVIEENALTLFKLLIKKVIYVERSNVQYPNPNVIPYALDSANNLFALPTETLTEAVNEEEGVVVMSNTGAGLYMAGKEQKALYGMKVSRGLLKKSHNVLITSPRAGIIQVGEGLFDLRYLVNNKDRNAVANKIDRLSTFFHEARHSDGNGVSLGFAHSKCPKGHDLEGAHACDSNKNGPYTVGALMHLELLKTCGTGCSEKDLEVSKLKILDSFNRILPLDSKGQPTTNWDPKPESL